MDEFKQLYENARENEEPGVNIPEKSGQHFDPKFQSAQQSAQIMEPIDNFLSLSYVPRMERTSKNIKNKKRAISNYVPN